MNVQPAHPSTTQTPKPAHTLTLPAHLRRLVLVGFMGAGKTTVGSLLATRLGWDFLDLDAYIESRTGLAVSAIFAAHGEAHFRQLESQALASALGRTNLVLALGGGTPEILSNCLLIEQTPATATIFLNAPFRTLFDRCVMQTVSRASESAAHVPSGHARPLLADRAKAEARFLKRQPLYRRLASITVDTASLNTEETITALLDRLSQRP